jgi:hypothetical protein
MNNRTHNQPSASQIPPGNPLFDTPYPATDRSATPPRSSASSAVKQPPILTAEDAENAENSIPDAPPPATDPSAVKTAFPPGAWQREQTPPRSSASSAVKHPSILTAEDAENAENAENSRPVRLMRRISMVGNEGAGPNVSVAGATCDRQRN